MNYLSKNLDINQKNANFIRQKSIFLDSLLMWMRLRLIQQRQEQLENNQNLEISQNCKKFQDSETLIKDLSVDI